MKRLLECDQIAAVPVVNKTMKTTEFKVASRKHALQESQFSTGENLALRELRTELVCQVSRVSVDVRTYAIGSDGFGSFSFTSFEIEII